MHLTDDHHIMLAVKDGDLDKLGQLFEKYHKPLYHFFLRQTSKPQASEDLVQDVFFRILKYRHTYRAEGKFTTWMFSVAHSALMEHFRKKKRKVEPLEMVERQPSNDPLPDTLSEQADESELIKKALSLLSDEKREVLILSRYENMKYEEIAQVQNCKVGTIKARVHWALKDLSKIYKGLTGETSHGM